MRDIADWNYRRVRFRGLLSEWRPAKDGSIRYLLKDLRVKLYEEGESEKSIDHLWFYVKPEFKIEGITRLTLVQALGNVYRYQRSNNQGIDYGIELVPTLPVCRYLANVDSMSIVEAHDRFVTCVKAIDDRCADFKYEFSWAEIQNARNQLLEWIDTCKATVESTKVYEARRQAMALSRGQLNPDPVRLRSPVRAPARGFGG